MDVSHSTAHSSSDCLNCDAQLPISAGYCPRCGQAQPTHRLSTAHVLHELLHVFTHADKSIFSFMGQVLVRPGQVVADYLAGRRKRYFSPFQFLLMAVGLATLLAKTLHYYEAVGAGIEAKLRAKHASAEALARAEAYFHSLGVYFNVWWLLLLPLHALVVWGIYGRRPVGLNYAESVLVQVVVGCAFQLWLLLALPTVLGLLGQQPGASTALLQGTLTVAYLLLIGRRGLGLGWRGAGWRAFVAGGLVAAINFGINYAAFNWYVYR